MDREIWEIFSKSIDESLLVLSGFDIDGSAMYVGRSCFGNNILPAKVIPKFNSTLISVAYDGCEHPLKHCEVLINSGFRWINFSDEDPIPSNAVQAGISEDGVKQFIGRAYMEGSLIPGRIPNNTRSFHLPFEGIEWVKSACEILVCDDGSDQSLALMTINNNPSSSQSTTTTLAPKSTCSICLEENIEIVGIFMDCGHACLCEECIEKVNSSNRNQHGKINCPICRSENLSARKIFYI